MTTVFEDLMTALNEVDPFLAGKTANYNAGYKVTVAAEVDVKRIRRVPGGPYLDRVPHSVVTRPLCCHAQ
jgi:hypothetical protein